MKTDKISFGTKPMIGEIAARSGLTKYKKGLTDGIFDAFEKLSKNDINDDLSINIGIKRGAKKTSTDILEISYWSKENNDLARLKHKSSVAFSPKSLEKLSKTSISKLILSTYEKLTKSDNKISAIAGYPVRDAKNKISPAHKNKIEELLNKFGIDDWTCA